MVSELIRWGRMDKGVGWNSRLLMVLAPLSTTVTLIQAHPLNVAMLKKAHRWHIDARSHISEPMVADPRTTQMQTCCGVVDGHGKVFFPEQLEFCRKLHCAQARFSPLVGDYNLRYGNYKSVAMWDAFDMLRLQQPPGCRHRATTDAQAMRMIWNWLEESQTQNLLSFPNKQNPDIQF